MASGRATAVLPGKGNLLGGQRSARARLRRTERSSRLPLRDRPPAAAACLAAPQPLQAKPRGSSVAAGTERLRAPAAQPCAESSPSRRLSTDQTLHATCNSRAGQGDPRGLLPGKALLQHCKAPKPRRSLASFLPPRSPAARSRLLRCRRCGLQAQTPHRGGQEARHHSETAPPPSARHGPLPRRPALGTRRPRRQPQRPAAAARPALHCALERSGRGTLPQLVHRAKGSGSALPGREGTSSGRDPHQGDEVASLPPCPSRTAVTGFSGRRERKKAGRARHFLLREEK